MSNDLPDVQRQLAALTAAAAALARGATFDASLDAILSGLAAAVGARAASVFLGDPDRPDLLLAGVFGIDEAGAGAFAAEAADPSHPIAIAARDVRAVFGRTGVGTGGAGAVVADIPLVVTRAGTDLPLGVVSFAWSEPHEVDEGEERLVRAAADLLAAAVDRTHLLSLVGERSEWFERMAHTDPLTGLANRRTFDRVLELELARAGRQGGDVSVAMFDVDGLGAANEAGGHETGDAILRRVAAVLAESVRLVDTVARYGGDEFVLVAPGSAGMAVSRRVLEGVARLEPVGGHAVSVSVGVARFPADGTTGEELLAAAEAALAVARSTGAGSIADAGVGAG